MGGVSMEWKVFSLSDIAHYSQGKQIPLNLQYLELNELRERFIRIVDFTSNWSQEPRFVDKDPKYLVNIDDIVMIRYGTPGKVFRGHKGIIANNLFKITFNEEIIDKDYAYWYLNQDSVYKQLMAGQSSSTMPAITFGMLKYIMVRVPPISYQRRIASILSSLDRKIELNNKINADLEEMAQAIFKNWLSECSDDVTIGELSLNITNYEKTDAEEVVLINSSDVTEGYFDHHNYSPNKNLKGHFKKRFQKGDILYSQVRPRNRHWAYCNFDANDYLASTQLMVIRNNPSLITSILLYQYIISDNVWKEFTLKTETRSGTFPQGNYEDLSQIRVPYNSDVEGISNQLETLYAKMFMLEKENSRLSTLRDTLLPRLMSGELEVPE